MTFSLDNQRINEKSSLFKQTKQMTPTPQNITSIILLWPCSLWRSYCSWCSIILIHPSSEHDVAMHQCHAIMFPWQLRIWICVSRKTWWGPKKYQIDYHRDTKLQITKRKIPFIQISREMMLLLLKNKTYTISL